MHSRDMNLEADANTSNGGLQYVYEHTHTNVHNCVMLYVICCKRGGVGREASPTWKEREGTHNDVGGALWLIAYVRTYLCNSKKNETP